MKDKKKILTKNEVLTLIIGMLLGAIITASIFLIVKSDDKNNMPNMDGNMPMGEKADNNFNNNDTNESDTTNEETES